MVGIDGAPRAVIVLIVEGRDVPLGIVRCDTRGDLVLVDDLLRLKLAAARHGWSIRLVNVHRDLRELLDLVGFPDGLEG